MVNKDGSQDNSQGVHMLWRWCNSRGTLAYCTALVARHANKVETMLVGAVVAGCIGMVVGVGWAIEHQKVRWRFLGWTFAGWGVGSLISLVVKDSGVMLVFLVLGLFVGVVSALISAGAYDKNGGDK